MRPRVFLTLSQMRSSTQSVLRLRSGVILGSATEPARHLHHPLHGLVVDPAEIACSSIAAQFDVGVDNIHALPLRLQWAPPVVAGVGLVTSTIATPGVTHAD